MHTSQMMTTAAYMQTETRVFTGIQYKSDSREIPKDKKQTRVVTTIFYVVARLL